MDGLLWRLIESEAESIAEYFGFLDSEFAKTSEAEPFVEVVRKIISDKLDHVEALKILYGAYSKSKSATDITDVAKAALAEYRERNKLIK